MTTKIWRGDATAVAQVTTVVPVAAVLVGDIFALAINGKRVSVTATAANAANVAALFVTAIGASDDPEWAEVTATVSTNTLILTASEAGVPFIVTADSSLDALQAVSVTTTTQGVAAVNCVQSFTIPLSAAGTFTIVLGDQITSAIAVAASAATVQTAIQLLTTIGASNATVAKTTDTNDDIYTVTFVAALAGTVIATLIVDLTSTKPLIRTIQAGSTTGTVQNEIQTVQTGSLNTTGNFTLTLDGQTTVSTGFYTTTAAQMQTDIQALSNVDSVTVTKDDFVFTIEFKDVDGSANQSLMTASVFSSSTTAVFRRTVTVTQPGVTAVNEVQVVTLNGTPTGGTFTVTLGANTTSGLAYNASAGTVQTALQGLASIGASNATVAGSAGGPWTVTFVVGKAATDMAEMTGNGASLTGASSNTLTVADSTASAGPNHWDTAANWSPSGVPISGDAVRFEDAGEDCLYGLAQSTVTLASLTISMGWQNRKLGLPHLNAGGYLEYREQQLTIGATVITVGVYQGTGPSRVYLDTGTAATAIEIRNTGSSADTYPAVVWIGTHASNSVVILDGEFGTAPYADTSATLDSLTMYGGRCVLRNAAIATSLKANRNPLTAFESTLGGKAIEV